MKKAVIIGSGFAGLSVACFMAKAGLDTTVLEKQDMPGGRARKLAADGFVFDMGPSWYWMPEVFERFFSFFDKKVADYYQLDRLDPSYRIYWPDCRMDIPADYTALRKLFESIEAGSAGRLDQFMMEAEYKYKVGINKLVYKPGLSLTEFLDMDLLKGIFKLDVFTSMKEHIGKYFKNIRLRQLMEFPTLFLGALAEDTPALYSLMNYADIKLGTWYPQGGMYKVVEGMYSLAKELGVKFLFDMDVSEIKVADRKANGVVAKDPWLEEHFYDADVVIGAADYHYLEMNLLPKKSRTYSKEYWDSRVMAPSCLLYFVGLNRKLKDIRHHSLFFDTDFNEHGKEIYRTGKWPEDPLFYVCTASVTDRTVATAGNENLFFLIPVATGLQGDTEELRETYFQKILTRFEEKTGQSVRDAIIYKKTYSVSNFLNDYNSFKGNAYGLANTLRQTAILKPSCRSNKIKNVFFTGQLTVPGPGVPPSLISGEVVAREALKYLNNHSTPLKSG
ncbi:MAG: phytoene desaturase family protein [Bacteroidota bacterium]|nr:phytoene desaturase family protein [Bacteroidota bacterium]MDP4213406.1 phytoene desaturase family protein [Bacteroidota bacterium]MDP4251241.1 phytoene desaturase family protein [Bacteroidota bacterium]